MHDLRSAFRQLTKAPGLSLVVVVSLAVGIGANTVVFSWLKSALLRPLPGVTAPVWLLETRDDAGNYGFTSWLEYKDLREMLPSFERIAVQRMRPLNLGDPERDARVFSEFVCENFFPVLGVRPQLGRFFRPDEVAQPGAAPVVVLSHDFWQRHFGGAADVLGRTLTLNHRTVTVIGVAPRGFHGGFNNLAFDLWVPLTFSTELVPATDELTQRTNRPYVMLARLKPGVTPGRARGELGAAARQMIAAYPETNKGLHYDLLPVWRSPRSGQAVVMTLTTLEVFTMLILIVICANTANLLLARASTRQREMGVRLALGAGPGRIVAQLLVESVCLASIGAAAGLLVALWGLDALARLPVPSSVPVRFLPELDGASLAFASLLGGVCGVAFGLAPALQLARGDVCDALRSGRGTVGGRSRMRDVLVAVEVGVALVVLVLAGLFLKSFRNAIHADPGFQPNRVMLAQVDLAARGYDATRGRSFLNQALERIAALPGIEAASLATDVPLTLGGVGARVVALEGREDDASRKAATYFVSAGYFATMGIPFVAGSDLAAHARPDLPLDAVVNETMAHRFWPEQSPVGRRFGVNGATYVVAGVVRDIRVVQLNEPARPVAWLTARTYAVLTPTFHVRVAAGDPRAVVPLLRTAITQLDPEVSLLDVRTLAQHVDNNLVVQRLPAQLLAVLGPMALALAAIGLYAVLAYAVAQRTQEIGVRLTLGATRLSVVQLMMWQSMRAVAIGGAVGWGVACAVSWIMRGLFIGVSFFDPLICVGVPVLLLGVALLACWLPARRAADVDPMSALRTE